MVRSLLYLAEIHTWRERAPKQGRRECCYVCGAPGGHEATRLIIMAGYRVKPQAIAFAHDDCLLTATCEHLEYVENNIARVRPS